MKMTVVGPGAMGCLFAALLREAGHEVWLLDRNAERARSIGGNGLTIEADEGARQASVHASAAPAALPASDMVWFFVKAGDTAEAALRAVPALGGGSTYVTLQNGLGNVEAIAAVAPAARIVCGTTSFGSTTLGWGHVRHAGSGPTVLAPAAPEGLPRAEQVRDVLNAAKVPSTVRPDPAGVLWSKLVVSAAINPLTALYGVPNGELLERPALRRLMHAAALEAAAVARAKGVALEYADAVAQAESICRCTAGNISSMLQDFRRGKRTEIEAITGAVVRAARETRVRTPANEMLLRAVQRSERRT